MLICRYILFLFVVLVSAEKRNLYCDHTNERSGMRVIRSQSGQSLIQVLVGAGIMGVVMMGAMSMMTHQSRETRALAETLAAMDLQKTLIATIADGNICHHILNNPTQRTFDSTSLSPTSPQVIRLNRIPISTAASAPSVAEVGEKASSYSNSLIVNDIRLNIKEGVGNTYLADWVVDFDSSKTVRQLRPVTVSARLIVDRTTPIATRIIACQGGGDESHGECNADKRGEVRHNPSSNTMEFCDGSTWVTWNPPSSPSSPEPENPITPPGSPCGGDKMGFTAYSSTPRVWGGGPTRLCCYGLTPNAWAHGGETAHAVQCHPY